MRCKTAARPVHKHPGTCSLQPTRYGLAAIIPLRVGCYYPVTGWLLLSRYGLAAIIHLRAGCYCPVTGWLLLSRYGLAAIIPSRVGCYYPVTGWLTLSSKVSRFFNETQSPRFVVNNLSHKYMVEVSYNLCSPKVCTNNYLIISMRTIQITQFQPVTFAIKQILS